MRLAFLIFFLSTAAHAAPLEGRWLGPVDRDGNQSTIQIYPCGDKFCGRVSAVTKPSSDYLVGQVILVNLEQESSTSYKNGLIRFDHLNWTFSVSVRCGCS